MLGRRRRGRRGEEEEGGRREWEMGDKWKDPMEITHKWGPVHCSHTPAS